jgi:DNA repair exonuclease SbcCD ATPase subunit
MKKIKINKISYENFKGIKSYTLNLEGNNASVSAGNNIGKTSLYDGFYWLLFDKNSQEQAQFKVKPFNAAGEDILGTDTIVEAELEIDGERVLLRKEVLEKWSNPKGSIEKVRGKDVKKYFINGIPAKTKKEYTDYISTVIDEQSFKLLTNPAFFASKGWDDRRKIVMDLVDEIFIDDVIASDPDFEILSDDLNANSLDDYKNGLNYQLKDLQKKEKDISTRIDEASKSVPETAESKADLELKLQRLDNEYRTLQKEESDIKNGGIVAKIQKEIEAIQAQIIEGRIKYSQTNQFSVISLQDSLNELSGRYRATEENLYETTTQIERLEKHTASEKERRTILLDQYHSEKSNTFDEHRSVCVMCGQELPADQIDKMKTKFNAEKSDKLMLIIAEGNQIKDTLEVAEKQLGDLMASKSEFTEQVMKLKAQGQGMKADIEKMNAENGDYTDTEEYAALVQKGLDLQAKITHEQESKQEVISSIREKLESIAEQMIGTNDAISLVNLANTQNRRVQELIDQRKEIVNAFNEKQGKLFMAEDFFKTRIKLQEEKVNQLFEITKFVFFGLDGTGEEKDMCSIIVNGSDFHTNLNNAARINAGLDIINTLSKAYGIAAPIFIDNAEGVNKLFETQSQMISLVVSTDPAFKVEVQG